MALLEPTFNTFAIIRRDLDAVGGMARIEMWRLRDANGNDRLGVRVAREIGERLALEDIGHFPELDYQKQYDIVRIYQKRSLLGRMMKALNDTTDKGDRKINSLLDMRTENLRLRDKVDRIGKILEE